MNEIPLSLYIVLQIIAFLLLIFSLIYDVNVVRLITSFITVLLSYVNAMLALSGNVVMIQSTGDSYSYIPIYSTTLNDIWTFIALLMVVIFVAFIVEEINDRTQPELETEIGD